MSVAVNGAFETWSEDLVVSLVEAHRHDRGPLLPILHDIKARCGCVDERSVAVLAEALNLSRAEVYGVMSFYRDFRTEPAGRVTVRICRAEACQSVGANSLADHARQSLGLDFGETTADGAVTLDQVFCFGNCALGPSVTIGGSLYGLVDPSRFNALLAEARGSS